ncbi:putative toxin [Cellulomonas sp. Y8]|uniref:putative toxin n=1 Tax=Cellulomonas sp. Y8 TaxID=2591145 RepID=UPI00143D084B|nr:putative toxin [Cellulomonas sp. Y8]
MYLRARYYDPSTGQFVSVDPAIDATRSMYGYTNGNPLQFVDPLGLEWWEALIDSNDESLVNNALQSFGAGVLDFFMNAANSLTRMTGSPAGDPFELIGNPNACDSTYDWSYKLGSLTTATAVTVGSFGGSGSRAASGAADDSMAGVRATGIAGEQAAGIVKNTQRIPSLSGTANDRIPDELTATAIGEVKNVAHLSYTAQLKDFNLYAQQNGMAFNLYVRESTTFSSALRDEITAGHINVIRLLM